MYIQFVVSNSQMRSDDKRDGSLQQRESMAGAYYAPRCKPSGSAYSLMAVIIRLGSNMTIPVDTL